MKDDAKTKKQLKNKLVELRQRIAELEKSEAERKQAEEALRESEERYRTLFEDSTDAVYTTTREGKFIDANQSTFDLLGYSREEMVALNARQLYVDATTAGRFQKEIEQKGFVRDYEVKLRKKDGTEIDCLFNVSVRRAPDGSILAYQGIVRDITDRKEAEEALRQSEEKYRNLVERANDGIAIAYDEVLQYVNPRLAQIIGYTVEELTGTPFANYIVPEEVQKVVDRYNRRMAGEDVIPIYETALRHKDGRRIDVELNTGIIAYKGKPADLVIVRDIIERKRAEQALRESEERFRVLVEESPFGVCLIEKDGHYKYINPKFTEIFGYTLEDIPTGQAWFHKAYPDQKYRKQVISTWISDLKESKGGEPRPRTFNIIRKDGSERVVHFRPATMKSGNQFVICEDVTELKRAEEALKESEQRYRTLVQSSSDAILMMGKKRNVVTCNQGFLNLFGYKKREIEGKSIRIIHQSDESFHSFGKTAYPVINRTGSFRTEWEFMHKDGTIFPVETVTSAIRSPDGSIASYIASIRDITERKKAEEEHNKLQSQLERAQRMEAIGTLASGITHDFNNILSAVIGYAELAREDVSEGSKAQANLQEVYKAGIRAKDLVGQILAFSRQREHEQKPVRISFIIKEALGLLRPSLPTTIDIRQNIQTESDTVLADPSQIHQVLMNLCTNASHAMREKGGILELTLEEVYLDPDEVASYPGLTPGAYVRLTVSDTGHGMNRRVMKRIFDPYFTTKKKGVGTGLGLAVVDGIVKTHGGAITVYSELEKGTTFHVYLPRIEHPEAAVEAEGIEPFPTGHEHILFVDDEKPLVDIGKQMLERLGYQVTTRTSSTEALEAFSVQPEKFDLVITDQTMPTMTGETLAKQLTQIRADIPIILCTGYSQILSKGKLGASGIREVLRKPIITRDMAKTIRRVLEKSEAK